MAIGVKDLVRWPANPGAPRQGLIELTLDGAYPTGGWPITPKQLKFDSTIFAMWGGGLPNGYNLTYDTANKKLMAFVPAGTQAAANDAALNTQKATVMVIGY